MAILLDRNVSSSFPVHESNVDTDKLLREAIFEREKGSVKKSIKMFHYAKDTAKDPKKILEIGNHLGLAYWLDKNYIYAHEIWIDVYKEAKGLGDGNSEAVALRNLSRKELYFSENGYNAAYQHALEAVELARRLQRKDVVWFKHAVFSAFRQIFNSNIASNSYADRTLKGIVKEEFRELWKVWWFKPSEKQKKKWKEKSKENAKERKEVLAMHRLEVSVWLAGALMDWAIAYGKVSKPFLLTGRFFTRILKLKRREEQISNLLLEMK